MLEQRMRNNENGDPVCTITLTGMHDIVRFADRMLEWQSEFGDSGRTILRSCKRRMSKEQWAWWRSIGIRPVSGRYRK